MKLNIIVRNISLLLIGLILLSSSLLAQDRNILSYNDRGIKYYPKYIKKGVTRITKASWYGKPFHGRLCQWRTLQYV
jgi:rare lipoprotein A (peptidoglycan hydrolase)